MQAVSRAGCEARCEVWCDAGRARCAERRLFAEPSSSRFSAFLRDLARHGVFFGGAALAQPGFLGASCLASRSSDAAALPSREAPLNERLASP